MGYLSAIDRIDIDLAGRVPGDGSNADGNQVSHAHAAAGRG
jgi:hypothetical protein